MKTHNNKLTIRDWEIADASAYDRLINNEMILKNLRPEIPKSQEMLFDFIKNSKSGSCLKYLAIEHDGLITGGISFEMKMQMIIELGCFWIGIQYQKLGLGRKALSMLIDYIFNKYPDYKISLQTISTNVNVIAMAKDLGFKLKKEMEQTAEDYKGNPIKLFYFEKHKYS